MKKNNEIKILVFPDDRHEPKGFSFKRRTAIIVIVLAALVFLINIIIAFSYGKLVNTAAHYYELRGKHQVLFEQVKRLNELEKEFAQLKKYNRKIREIFGKQISFMETSMNVDSLSEFIPADRLHSIFRSIPSQMPVKGFISRNFDQSVHPAIDIVNEVGTPIVAVAAGRVMASGWNQKYGNFLIIYHGNGIFSVYKHTLRNVVQEQEFVEKSQTIALLGGTGKISSGPHLHLEVWKENTPLDPMLFFKQ